MNTAVTITRILHVAVAAAWFGHKLLIPFDLGTAAHTPEAADAQLVARIDRARVLGLATGLATLVTGIALILMIGSQLIPRRIYLGLGIVIGMFAVGVTMARSAWDEMKAAIEHGEVSAIRKAGRHLATALNLESSLWLVVLITMLM